MRLLQKQHGPASLATLRHVFSCTFVCRSPCSHRGAEPWKQSSDSSCLTNNTPISLNPKPKPNTLAWTRTLTMCCCGCWDSAKDPGNKPVSCSNCCGIFELSLKSYSSYIWEFPSIGVPCFGILITRILLFRVLYIRVPYCRIHPSEGLHIPSRDRICMSFNGSWPPNSDLKHAVCLVGGLWLG